MLSPILGVISSDTYKPLLTALNDLGIKSEQVSSGNIRFIAAASRSYSAAIIEWDTSSPNRWKILKEIQKTRPNLPVVALASSFPPEIRSQSKIGKLLICLVMSGDAKEDLPRLLDTLRQFLPELQAQVLTSGDLFWIKTPNEKMKEILALVDILKDEPSSVLIEGENGTGKDVIARLLHFSGRRHKEPFVAINCAAIPETLLESELFGHEKGSFTGATEKRIGKFELAHKGTAFLDEIGDMPLNTQAKILRVLETGEIELLGSHEKISVDIRIAAATNKNLLQQIEKGLFRQDLYYRINTFTIHLPPLRQRSEDVLPLARHFVDIHVSRREGTKKILSREAEQLLLQYDWPGNVRELRNTMERAVVITPGGVIGPEALPEEVRRHRQQEEVPTAHGDAFLATGPTMTAPPVVSLKELERKAIINALSQVGNNATKAAKQLGISKATLFRKLKEYGISRRLMIQT